MICYRNNNSGFSLVETIVASIIAVVLGAVIYTVFLMYDSNTSETTVYTQLQLQYENLAEQIAIDTRRASRVLSDINHYSNPFNPLEPDTATGIIMVDTAGVQIAGYRIENQIVEEFVNGGWVPFESGVGTIGAASASRFLLNNTRDAVQIDLTLQGDFRGEILLLTPRRDLYVCRNQRLP